MDRSVIGGLRPEENVAQALAAVALLAKESAKVTDALFDVELRFGAHDLSVYISEHIHEVKADLK